MQVLAIPYSPDFAAVFLPLVQNSEITAPLKNAKGTDPVSITIIIERNDKDSTRVLHNNCYRYKNIVAILFGLEYKSSNHHDHAVA